MKSKYSVKLAVIIIIVSLFSLIRLSQAQEILKPLIYMGEYKVKPDKVDEFESVIKDFIKEMIKYDMPYTFLMFSTSNFIYYSLNEFDNYSMLDKFNADWWEVERKMGKETIDKYHEIEFNAINSFKGTLIKFRPNQSYISEKFLFGTDVSKFVHCSLYYIYPSKRQDWSSFQKKWVELYKNKNIRTSFLTFTGDIGYEMPVWIYLNTGKNQADYFNEIEKINAILGDDMEKLRKKYLPLIKKVEERYCYYRPDLSYIHREQ